MIGKVIGNYQITSELAQGGMGSVYRGRHLHLPREVVVKSILLGAFSPSAQIHLKARFRREAFVQSQLDHPNIVRVYEFFAAEENYYLVMEYVQGMTLRDLLARQGPPTPAQAVYLLKQALESLDYAHNFGYQDESDHRHTGVIHRDIKPANILLDTKGKLKITDFGIVKVMGDQTGMGMTQSGFHPGTVEYMSPEQLLGLPIDERSDLYSLGVTFYEMLTGRLPFQRSATGSDWEIRKGHIELEAPPIQDLRSEVHPQLAAIIMRSLHKNPNERYQSAARILEAVRDYEQNYAEKEQALRSPSGEVTQPQVAKPTLQAMKSTLLDETATLLARLASEAPPTPRKSHLEDEVTIPMISGASSFGSSTEAASGEIAVVKVAPTSQPDPLRRRWPLAVGGLGLLLAGAAAGAILFSQRKPADRVTQSEVARAQALTSAATPTPSPVIRAINRPRPSPTAPEKTAFRQAQNFERQERYDEAIKVYENYIARNPGAPDINIVASYLNELGRMQELLASADAAMNARLYPVAKRQYLRALELRPGSQRAKLGLADAEIKMKSMPPPGTKREFPFGSPEFPRPDGQPSRPRQGQSGRKVKPEQTDQPQRPFDQSIPPRILRRISRPTPTPQERKP